MSDETARPTARARLTLVLLAAATLLVITTETLPVGLLPQMARGLHVGDGQIGLLVTAYGGVVVVGAIPLSAAIARVPPRLAMSVVLAVFVVSIAVTAASAGLGTALVARLVGGAAHAVFSSCSFSIAASVVAERWRGRAVALVGAGNALALALGVPAATALGAATGWRVPFWSASVLLLLIGAVLALSYRPLHALDTVAMPSVPAQLRVAVSGPLARVALTIVLVMTAHFLTYTYISPLLTGAGVPEAAVGFVLVGYGVAGAAALLVGGRLTDRRPRPLLIGTVVVTILSLALLWVFRGAEAGAIGATALWGFGFGAAPVLWQLVAVRAAPSAESIGPAVVNSAFNVGISLGALVGGAAIASVPPATLALLSVVLLVPALALVTRRRWLPGTP
jgi:predicted MFS family arabinose efflux permease